MICWNEPGSNIALFLPNFALYQIKSLQEMILSKYVFIFLTKLAFLACANWAWADPTSHLRSWVWFCAVRILNSKFFETPARALNYRACVQAVVCTITSDMPEDRVFTSQLICIHILTDTESGVMTFMLFKFIFHVKCEKLCKASSWQLWEIHLEEKCFMQ